MLEPTSDLPLAVIEPFTRLVSRGHRGWLTGEGLLALLRGETLGSHEAIADASASELLAVFERAVPTQPGIVTVPTAAGPIDFRVGRVAGAALDRLREADFRIFAIALDPLEGCWSDPLGGLEDIERRRLRLASKSQPPAPLLGVRAARIISELGYEPDDEVEETASRTSEATLPWGRPALRSELRRLLLGPHCLRGLTFLRRTGIEALLARNVREDAARVVARLPAEIEIRLTGWLRGATARRLLRRCQFGAVFSQRIYELLDHHPIDGAVSHTKDPALGRLLRRLGEDDIARLFALREAEIGVLEEDASAPETKEAIRAARESVASMHKALERARTRMQASRLRPKLALDGSEIAEWLGCAPGPRIGQATRHLSAWVLEDPARNEVDALRTELARWDECSDTRGQA